MTHKTCTKCRRDLLLERDFYRNKWSYRGECKECTKKNIKQRYQERDYWKVRNKDPDARRQNARQYYADNQEKFALYRKRFSENHPNYYQERKRGSAFNRTPRTNEELY